jgi:phospholipase/lecithinase/hemolysin
MKRLQITLLALASSLLVAGCGGGSKGGDQTLRVKYSSQVIFGDSLADVGSYAVGSVAAAGGGKYTINGNSTAINDQLTGRNWVDVVAAQIGVPVPCAAQTGLKGDASLGFSAPVVNHAGCFGYAQGGSRVTDPDGASSYLSGSPLGQLTVPVTTQVANHLAISGGKFKGDELVLATAGGNDVSKQLEALTIAATQAGQAEGAKVGAQTFGTTLTGLLAAGASNPATAAQAIGLALLTESARPGHTDQTVVGAAVMAAATQPGNAAVASPAVYGPMVAQAQAAAATAGAAAGAAAGAKYATDHGPDAVVAMGKAGAELAAIVKTQMIAKGANYVVVGNLGDFANAPVGKAQSASAQALIAAMVNAFNAQLAAGLAGEAKALVVDLYTISHDQIINPLPYGLTATDKPACAANALGVNSLMCTAKNLSGADVSHYMFADDRHPTPYEYRLIGQYVLEQMIIKGWL